jgi:hypothetical protein
MDSLENSFPILAHEAAGVDYCGRIVLTISGKERYFTISASTDRYGNVEPKALAKGTII